MPKHRSQPQACIDYGGSPRKTAKPTQVVIVVILYWTTQVPLPEMWSSHAHFALHSIALAVSFQFAIEAGRTACRSSARAWRWMTSRVDVGAGFHLRVGRGVPALLA